MNFIDALSIIKNGLNRQEDEIVVGSCETEDKYLFSVKRRKDIGDAGATDVTNYARFVDKKDGSTGSLTFFEYADLVDNNQVYGFKNIG